jgi:polyisoprenoid-binding protein YceI
MLLAAAMLVGLGCANPAEDKPEAVVEAPVAEPAAPAAGDTYVFAEGSSVSWVGSKVTGSHDGGFHTFSGEIVLVDGDPASSRVSVEIDTTSLWSDNEKLTNHLKSADFFEVETHPTATFTSTSITEAEEGYTLTGNLELHGVTKSITFPASITVEEGRITAAAEFFIQRFDFDIVYPGRPDDLIRDEVVIQLELVAEPAPAEEPAA